MAKFAKTQILGWKLGWNVKLKNTDAQPGIFWEQDRFLGTEALW